MLEIHPIATAIPVINATKKSREKKNQQSNNNSSSSTDKDSKEEYSNEKTDQHIDEIV